jgi:pimeloyl-ACP methyl ester carboxylesterase
MLVNPGGPGGSGLTLPVLGRGDIIPGDGDREYDWIGFDPRGVGNSRPVLTCDGAYNGYDRPNYVPTTEALERAWLRKARGYSSDCRASDGRRLLNHMKTRDVVADMDSLRKALRQRKINFYGFSYGTYLAQVYATTYPNRVRRFVMDGNVDPRKIWYRANLDQDLAFERTIKAWFAWLAKYNSVFGLGDNADIVEATYYRQLNKLDARPALGVIGPDELNDVLVSAGYYVYDWVGLGEAFAALVNENDATQIKAY